MYQPTHSQGYSHRTSEPVSSKRQQLASAIKNGDCSTVHDLCNEGVDVSAKFDPPEIFVERRPLHVAVRYQQHEVARPCWSAAQKST
ncbi:hypothetical protein MKZ38_004702 [Zalerion maritima]|uniref:Uncharacterized protein n=1 Tax=Zalerion maritima TaxID=339359 RepID=A0AAD5WQV8_9PEZI|nr:hypothetical protein MKZ38_004702 [Zalerion maritima]